MKVGALPATLLVSIDAPTAPAAKELAQLLEKRQVPAIWRMAKPAAAAETPWLMGHRVRHEMALLLEDNWAGPSASRGQFARELTWRLDSAKASGIEVATVAAKAVLPAQRLETLARQHVALVCDNPAPSGRSVRLAPLRYGMWQAPVSVSLPRQKALFSAGAATQCRKVIDQSVKNGQLAHLFIDAAAMSGDSAQFAVVDQALSHAHQLHDRGELMLDTAQSMLAKGRQSLVVAPARSIMRAA